MSRTKLIVSSCVLATANPTVTDDASKGAYVGQRWLHGTSEFICTDPTIGAAVWTAVGGGGGGGAVSDVNGRTGSVTLGGTDIPAFVGAGASHAPGAVPDPGATPNTTDFLRRDGAWATPSGGGGGGDPGAAYQVLIAATANLVSHWIGNDAPGSTTMVDSVGGNDMARRGSDGVAGMPGAIQGTDYLSWKATSGFRNTSPSGLPLGATARTMIAWVRSIETATGAMAFGYGSAGTRNAFIFYMNGSSAGDFNMSAYSDDLAVTGLRWNDSNWHMLAASYDGSTGGVLYFDGVPVDHHTFGGALTTALNGDGVWAGASASAGGFGNNLAGQFANLSIVARQMSDAEILALWRAARG